MAVLEAAVELWWTALVGESPWNTKVTGKR
jgi:hypothetical protein